MKRIVMGLGLVAGLTVGLVAQQGSTPGQQARPATPPQTGGIPGGGPEEGMNIRPPNDPNQKPAFQGQTRAPEEKLGVAFDVVQLAEGLGNPWGLAFLPDGRMLLTERAGRLRVLSSDGTQMSEPVEGLPAVDARGQGGLLDIALDPAFQKNQLIYWSYAEPRGDNINNTAVARGRFVDGATPRVENVEVVFHQSPSLASPLHFGGRILFDRDGKMFVTLGDRSITEGRMQAQRMDGLLGKIVRLNPDGTVPQDNPFVGRDGVKPEIWSLGHRNIQAAAFHPETGELWEVEHGTRGGDELNLVKKGLDYGWPTIAYGIEYRGGTITGGIQQHEGMEQPNYYWDPVIAPSGMVFYTGTAFPAWKNSLFIGGLGSMNLVRLTIRGDRVVGEERLLQDLQPRRERIRDVRQGPDGALYVLTDSQRGRLLKLVPRAAAAAGGGQPGAASGPQPYVVGNPLGLPVTPAADGAFAPISSRVKVYGAIYSAESCSYDDTRGLIVVPNRGVGQNVQANNAWISLINHDGSVHTARWIGVQNPGQQRDNSQPPLVLNEPFGSEVANGLLYLADRDGGTATNDPSVAIIRRFRMDTGAPAGETRVAGATGFNDIAVTKDGTVYATVTGRDEGAQLWKVVPDGTASILVRGLPLAMPNGVAMDPQGNVVVVNMGNPDVLTFSPDGALVRTEQAAQAGSDGLVIMPDGTKYVSSVTLGGVSRIRPGKTAELIAENIPSAASMCYDAGANQLVIPMNANNALAFVPLQ